MSALTAVWNRVFAVLGRASMYRLVLVSLGILTAYAVTLSLLGVLAPTPIDLHFAVPPVRVRAVNSRTRPVPGMMKSFISAAIAASSCS